MRKCFNISCDAPRVEVADLPFNAAQARCRHCGCAGPTFSRHAILSQIRDEDFHLVDSGAIDPVADRAFELWDDLVTRMETSRLLGSLAAEARRAAR